MKRFHVNVSVADLSQSIEFYNTLFGQEPSVSKSDYAKWMLDDPRVNFAISQSSRSRGVNHIGLQADTVDELGEIQERLRHAGKQTFDQPDAECCYARSTKTWARIWRLTHQRRVYPGLDAVLNVLLWQQIHKEERRHEFI